MDAAERDFCFLTGTVRCGKCKKVKSPEEDFYRDERLNSGIRLYCKSCMNSYLRKYREANRSKVNGWEAAARDRRRAADPEKFKKDSQKRNRDHYERNKEKIKAQNLARYHKKKELDKSAGVA
jgi:hypothetical protein